MQESYQQIQSIDNPIINLLLVMVIIWTTGVVFRKIRQPPVLGELLAGIIFGPTLLGIIKYDREPRVVIQLLNYIFNGRFNSRLPSSA